MAKVSPTQRSLAECRKRGWVCQVVEHWNAYAKIRVDLFGVIDILACTPEGILGIQATSDANVSARVAKAEAEPRLQAWFQSGGRFAVWGWGKKGPRGKVKHWTLREVALHHEHSPRSTGRTLPVVRSTGNETASPGRGSDQATHAAGAFSTAPAPSAACSGTTSRCDRISGSDASHA